MKPDKPLLKPVIIDPSHCRPVDKAGPAPVCVSCAKAARWHAPPTVEGAVEQVEVSKVHLVPLCSICTIYKSILFKGLATRVDNFIHEVEKTAGKPFKKASGKLTEEGDATAIVASIWMVSYGDLRRRQMMERTAPTESERAN